MNKKTLYGSLFLLLLSLNVHARPMAIMHEKTFDLSSHELSIQQPSICPGDKNNETKQLNIYPKHFSDTNNTGNLTCSLCQVLVNVVDNQIQHGNHTIIEITQVIKGLPAISSMGLFGSLLEPILAGMTMAQVLLSINISEIINIIFIKNF